MIVSDCNVDLPFDNRIFALFILFTCDPIWVFPISIKFLVANLILTNCCITLCMICDIKMIVNPDKFESIIIQKSNQTSKPKQFLTNDVVDVASSVKLLGIHHYMTNITSTCISVTFVNLLPINLMLL